MIPISFKQKLQTIGALVLMVFALMPWSAAASSESIKSFDVKLQINTDGTLNVTERILYDFGSNIRHGIFRDIPLGSKDAPTLLLTNPTVSDLNGNPYPFSYTQDSEAHFKIGDADVNVSGEVGYIIAYTVSNVYRGFLEKDELYWNATGNNWLVPILSSSVVVELPATILNDPALLGRVENYCYPGTLNDVKADCSITKTVTGYSLVSGATSAGQGLTISTSVPKGVLNNLAEGRPAGATKSVTWRSDASAIGMLVAVGVSFLCGLVFLTFRRNTIIPKALKGAPIVTEYNAPDAISAADIAYLLNRNFDQKEFGVIFIDLAVRGYLKIRYIDKKGLFGSDNYELIKLKGSEGLSAPYLRLYNYLFNGRDVVLMSDLKNDRDTVARLYRQVGDDVKDDLEGKGLIKNTQLLKPTGIKRVVAWVGGAFFTISVFRELILVVVPVILIVFLFAYIKNLNSLTTTGLDVFKKILGFGEFLKMTEQDRLRLLNAPELKPELFEKFLPFAMSFGIEKEWAKKFEGLAITPGWYEDGRYGYGSPLNTLILANMIGDFNNNASAASTYSSGGGGGGFSGGGSGGGGGGSW